jgi:hypothetical protein
MPNFGLPSARAEASRRNGAKSCGPKTPKGKARSAQNALKHGFRAQKHVVLPDEDGAAFLPAPLVTPSPFCATPRSPMPAPTLEPFDQRLDTVSASPRLPAPAPLLARARIPTLTCRAC